MNFKPKICIILADYTFIIWLYIFFFLRPQKHGWRPRRRHEATQRGKYGERQIGRHREEERETHRGSQGGRWPRWHPF